MVAQVTDKFLACGSLEHGFARIRCDACAHEYLLAPVPHRHVVLIIPKRLRAYCLFRRRRLGEIARVAARTCTSSSPMAGSDLTAVRAPRPP